MKEKIIRLLKDWSLPLGMGSGAVVYLLFRLVPPLAPLKPAATATAAWLVPVLLFTMLFITFCKVNPRHLRLRAWHVWLCAFQAVACLALAAALHGMGPSVGRVLTEGAMVCIICPTATAAAVITGRLGGSEPSVTAYTIVSNVAAAALIPLAFPLSGGHAGGPFLTEFALILRRVFPLLICPLLAAWALRLLAPRLHARVVAACGGLPFYLWAFSLVIVVAQTLRALANSPVSAGIEAGLAAVGLVTCVVQFALGKWTGSRHGDRISAGQGLGQKNTIFAIWVAGIYLSPVAALAPGSYILWQNIINSWQLWKRQKSQEAQ